MLLLVDSSVSTHCITLSFPETSSCSTIMPSYLLTRIYALSSHSQTINPSIILIATLTTCSITLLLNIMTCSHYSPSYPKISTHYSYLIMSIHHFYLKISIHYYFFYLKISIHYYYYFYSLLNLLVLSISLLVNALSLIYPYHPLLKLSFSSF